MPNHAEPKTGQWILGALLSPFLISALILFGPFKPLGDLVGIVATLALSLAAGIYCLWELPFSKGARIGLTVVYVPTATAMLVLFVFILRTSAPDYHGP